MTSELARQRFARLKQRVAIPGYLLVAWSLAGQWSRTEFVFRKAKELADSQWIGPLLFVGGIGWLGWLILRTSPTPGADRLERVKALLIEAATEYRKPEQANPKDFDEAFDKGWGLLSLQYFLRDAFQHWVLEDYQKFIDHEREHWKRAKLEYHYGLVTPGWLEDLSGRITERDLDFGFLLPESYEQYSRADPWQPNRRPLEKQIAPAQRS